MDEILTYFSNHINLIIIFLIVLIILVIITFIYLLIEEKKIETEQRMFIASIMCAAIEESRYAGLKEIKRKKPK